MKFAWSLELPHAKGCACIECCLDEARIAEMLEHVRVALAKHAEEIARESRR